MAATQKTDSPLSLPHGSLEHIQRVFRRSLDESRDEVRPLPSSNTMVTKITAQPPVSDIATPPSAQAALETPNVTAPSSPLAGREGLRKRLSGAIQTLRPSRDLQNVGSVARDHLANERTSWLRTSLSLASIGIAITQLFRLQTSDNGLPNRRKRGTEDLTVMPMLDRDQLRALDPLLVRLYEQQLEHAERLDALGRYSSSNGIFRRLGKPIGATFIALALLFLWLGSYRYYSVQNELAQGKFPPARRSVIIASLSILALCTAAFTAILVLIP